MARDDGNLALVVDEAVVDGLATRDVRRHALEIVDCEDNVEQRIVLGQNLEAPLGKCPLHLLTQIVQRPLVPKCHPETMSSAGGGSLSGTRIRARRPKY